MARARLSMAALLAGVSHLAIGTAYAASAGWDASRLPGDLKGSAVVVGAYGVFVGLKRVLRGGMAAFWTSTLGRWLIGRIAGTAVFAGLAGTGFFLAQQGLDPLLDGLVRLGVPLSDGLLGRHRAGDGDRPGRGRMDSAHARQGVHRQGFAPAAASGPLSGHGPRRIERVRGNLRRVGEPLEARHDPAWRQHVRPALAGRHPRRSHDDDRGRNRCGQKPKFHHPQPADLAGLALLPGLQGPERRRDCAAPARDGAGGAHPRSDGGDHGKRRAPQSARGARPRSQGLCRAARRHRRRVGDRRRCQEHVLG